MSDPAAADFGVTLSEPTPDRAPGALDETMPLLADGRLRLRAHKSMPMQQGAEAHRQLESDTAHERIILTLEQRRRHSGRQCSRSCHATWTYTEAQISDTG